jgi:fatty-acyl-CoA synthase
MTLDRVQGAPCDLWRVWNENAGQAPDATAIVHWVAGETPHRWTRAALIDAATDHARRLAAAGVRRGEVCAIIVRHHPEFYPLYMGVVALGALPAVLAYPNSRLHPDKFRDGLTGMSRKSGLDWLVTERDLEPAVRPLVEQPGSTIRGVIVPFGSDVPRAPFEPVERRGDEPCLLQHSSGTTGLQKGVLLSHEAVIGHVRGYGAAIDVREDDRVVSWLPLYHDMGLIAAFHLPLALGLPLVQLDPFEWVAAPTLLFEAIAAERGTLSWLPNFAYNILADRVIDEELEGLRFDSLRLLVNCSETVRAESHERFVARFRPYGITERHLSACYAMAETTFAVSQTAPGTAPRVLEVSRQALANGRLSEPADGEAVRRCVSSGRPIDGCEVRVVAESGGEVGEIAVRATSLFSGYRNDPSATELAMRDGWYHTGDLGFLHEEEVFVVGRRKDVIIVAGKNLYPEDIEDAVSRVPGVLPGRVVAFAGDDQELGTERVEVIAETEVDDEPGRATLTRAVIAAGMAIDITIARVHLVPSRWLIKSSAGKPSRAANRERVSATGVK